MDNKTLIKQYIGIVQKIARVEHRRIPNHMIEYEELVSIGIIAVQTLIKGKTEEIFEPETNMTRAEIATVIVRICSLFLEKLNYILNRSGKTGIAINKQSISFSDVATDAWYYDAIKTIVNLGIMNGRDNNYFEPEGFATRGEIAAIINRLSKYIDSKNYIAFN